MSNAHAAYPFTRGLHEIGSGLYAYLQPDGTWGWSNAGLVTDGDASLLVDTLFDLRLTREMLAAMRAAAPRATAAIGTLVNTHHNGDHCYGNELVGAREILASARARADMEREAPAVLAGFMKAAPAMGQLGAYLQHCFGAFEFEGITQTLPTATFTGRATRTVGSRAVEVIEVGPAHTGGDVLVHVPDARAVFTGDVVFVDATPIVWAGPVSHWIAACETILAMDVELVVPGHGPLTDKRGVRAVREYLAFIAREARARFDAGMSAREAAADIAHAEYDAWGDAERIAVNVATLYREFAGDTGTPDVAALFASMAELWQARRAR